MPKKPAKYASSVSSLNDEDSSASSSRGNRPGRFNVTRRGSKTKNSTHRKQNRGRTQRRSDQSSRRRQSTNSTESISSSKASFTKGSAVGSSSGGSQSSSKSSRSSRSSFSEPEIPGARDSNRIDIGNMIIRKVRGNLSAVSASLIKHAARYDEYDRGSIPSSKFKNVLIANTRFGPKLTAAEAQWITDQLETKQQQQPPARKSPRPRHASKPRYEVRYTHIRNLLHRLADRAYGDGASAAFANWRLPDPGGSVRERYGRGSVADWLDRVASPMERKYFEEFVRLLSKFEYNRGLVQARPQPYQQYPCHPVDMALQQQQQQGGGGGGGGGGGSVIVNLGPSLKASVKFFIAPT